MVQKFIENGGFSEDYYGNKLRPYQVIYFVSLKGWSVTKDIKNYGFHTPDQSFYRSYEVFVNQVEAEEFARNKGEPSIEF